MNLVLPVKSAVKSVLGPQRCGTLKDWARRSGFLGWWCRNDLPRLAQFCGTDKWGVHRYAQHYARHFAPMRNRPIRLLEIGVGGHHDPHGGGASLRMWKAWFPRASIYGLDLFDKSALQEPRITIFRGSQADPDCLRRIGDQIGPIDIIIDDGSHVNEHMIISFETLFPYVAEGGIYALEDLCTSYWPAFGGSEDPACADTAIAMCKRLIDGINWEEFSARQPQPFDQSITSAHFYRNLCLLYKGKNVQGTNKDAPHLVHL